MSKKRILGQYFTKEDLWLKPQVTDFINDAKCNIAYDPFAGAGDILNSVFNVCNINTIYGLDIDYELDWGQNDSLLNIPHVDNAVLVTNPPYITNYSAKRKGLYANLEKYFSITPYTDLYLLALDKMLEAQENVVAVIPETFINSNYKRKNRLHSLTILEENPFTDTEVPVLVACFDSLNKSLDKVNVYKNEEYVNTLGELENMRLIPEGNVNMNFNDKEGWLAVRCVDSTNPDDMLSFNFKNEIDYDWKNNIKKSSRLLTLINIDLEKSKQLQLINECNNILNNVRENSKDVILSPFKGNMKNGIRRRRLDFYTCRAIVEQAYAKTA